MSTSLIEKGGAAWQEERARHGESQKQHAGRHRGRTQAVRLPPWPALPKASYTGRSGLQSMPVSPTSPHTTAESSTNTHMHTLSLRHTLTSLAALSKRHTIDTVAVYMQTMSHSTLSVELLDKTGSSGRTVINFTADGQTAKTLTAPVQRLRHCELLRATQSRCLERAEKEESQLHFDGLL
ncbi:hypothetical protein QQF64_027511 [Cirrhinus molitorella]|uniref:Uncharacterized protein n=1 Tax=Cirrhinus molitorella TaxID=172907 RepID=A0ABR3NCL4_9TELE